jgi:hypothetical protein
MTQDSDSGDAVGDAGPATDERILAHQGKKRFNCANARAHAHDFRANAKIAAAQGLFIILPQHSPKLLPKCKLVPTWGYGFTRQELPG